ncbi:MAG: thioredoxin [Tissierellia bacterium]|nr:thioredoxin [Tissierellia bacterium]
MSEVKVLNTEEFKALVSSNKDKVMVVEFFASWCNPCKMLAPVLEDFAAKHKDVGVYKLDVDENSKLSDDLDIHSVPTLLFYKGGQIVKQVMGFQPLASIEKIVELI